LIFHWSATAAAASALLLFKLHGLSAADDLTVGALAALFNFKLHSALAAYDDVSCFYAFHFRTLLLMIGYLPGISLERK